MTLHQLNNHMNPVVPDLSPASPALRVEGLRAYYQTRWFGVTREVRAVDDIMTSPSRSSTTRSTASPESPRPVKAP
jgi:hypothetical protein